MTLQTRKLSFDFKICKTRNFLTHKVHFCYLDEFPQGSCSFAYALFGEHKLKVMYPPISANEVTKPTYDFRSRKKMPLCNLNVHACLAISVKYHHVELVS